MTAVASAARRAAVIMIAIAGTAMPVTGTGLSTATAAPAVRCRVAVTPLRFGRYNPFSPADTRADGVVILSCTAIPTAPISIAFNEGRSQSFQMRQMTGGTVPLAYNLFLDPAATMIWGDGTGGSQAYRARVGRPNVDLAVPVYGRIFARQTQVPIGAYADMLQVTVIF